MRILLLTQKLPLPAHDGYNLRVVHYLRHLGPRHTIRLVSLDPGSIDGTLREGLEGLAVLPLRSPPAMGTLARIVNVFSPEHLHDLDPQVRAAVEREAEAFRPDVVWSVGWRMLPHALGIAGGKRPVPLLADVVDEGAREAWLDLRARPTPRNFSRLVRVVRFERRFFPRAERCLFVSEQDARITGRLVPGCRTQVIPNGVDVEHYSPDPSATIDPDLLVFEGAMMHVPNAEGMVYFCREVLPLVRRERPRTRLAIVGRDPLPEVLALGGSQGPGGVTVTGFVDDVRPHVRAAAAFVCPLIGGAGLKNKLLQAWALGVPVVATPISLGGLRATDGENLLIASDAAGLARACLRLMEDRELAGRLAAAGRRTAVEHYSWEQAARSVEELLHSLVRLPSR